jgi:hypothetical protein
MKDLIGPINTSLGVVTVTPDFHADCNTGNEAVTASYSVVAYGPGDDTTPLQDENDPNTTETNPAFLMTCVWEFYLGPVAPENLVTTTNTCAGTLSLPSGSYTAVVIVTHSESLCESRLADGNVGPVDIVACCPPDTYCSDGDPCTIDDMCVDGVCVGVVEMCMEQEFVFFLVVTDVRGEPVGSVRCEHDFMVDPPLIDCASLDADSDPLTPDVLEVRPELTCDYWEVTP